MLKIPNNLNKFNFIIDCRHSFSESLSGGIIVLQKLADELEKIGHNVYILSEPMYNKNINEIKTFNRTNTNYQNEYFEFEPFEYPIENTISIYPEITIGNPFNTKYVVRWLLSDSKPEIEDTWSKNDLIYNFANFKTSQLIEKKQLTVFDFRFDDMVDRNNKNRNGFCFIKHKNTPDNYLDILSQFKPTILNGWEQKGAWSFLSEEFNKHEYFITFDRRTAFCALAAMCGCKAIILNEDKSVLPIEFRLQNPLLQFGVSYGLNDISWSNKTIDLVWDNILQLDKQHKKTIIDFVSDMKKIVYDK